MQKSGHQDAVGLGSKFWGNRLRKLDSTNKLLPRPRPEEFNLNRLEEELADLRDREDAAGAQYLKRGSESEVCACTKGTPNRLYKLF